MSLSINIVCLDVPYPANYGGAINMFHKIRWLHKSGVTIYLHCYTYADRIANSELNKYCAEVTYYNRETGIGSFLSLLPYNVKSRSSTKLKQNLLKNNFPILFEALHSCFWINDLEFKNRLKLFRESNIEHHYFYHLAKNENNFFKKIYFYIESFKLKHFEKQLKAADVMLIVSKDDEKHFLKKFPLNKIKYLPSFHQNDNIIVKQGNSNYILYHGNLSVSENYGAADWLIENVFSKLNHKVVIAGLNPPQFLIDKISKHIHIELVANCSREKMDDLIENAQIHCLYTPQATGLKLKLLNVLFKGRFVIANSYMLAGTQLHNTVTIANTPQDYINQINTKMSVSFSDEELKNRLSYLEQHTNQVNINKLMEIIKGL